MQQQKLETQYTKHNWNYEPNPNLIKISSQNRQQHDQERTRHSFLFWSPTNHNHHLTLAPLVGQVVGISSCHT